MAGAPPPSSPLPNGYLSEADKRRFTITAGVLGAVFFFAQFLVPMVLMLALMPGFMLAGPLRGMPAELSSPAYWRGRVWFVEEVSGERQDAPPGARIMRLAVGREAEPEHVADAPPGLLALLPADDRLWVIGEDYVSHVRGDALAEPVPTRTLGVTGPPLMHGDAPALVDEVPGGLALRVFRDGEWKTVELFRIVPDEHHALLADRLRVLPQEGQLHLFVELGGRLFRREGVPTVEEDPYESWEAVGAVAGAWTAFLMDGEPVVLALTHEGPGDWGGTLAARRKVEGRWERFFSIQQPFTCEISAFDADEPLEMVVVARGMPWSLRVLEIADGELVATRRAGQGFPFPASFGAMMFAPHLINLCLPLCLALVLTLLMRRHRVTEYVVGERRVPYASVIRRGLAQVVDFLIVSAPFVAGFGAMFGSMWDLEADFVPNRILLGMGLIGLGLLWALLCLLVFSALEGSSGRTPGKWLLGIRVVGTDLAPCGFGRALVRNLLKVVDGFFNFLIGLLLVALTENWQRLGDLAARTVVVRPGREADVLDWPAQ
jgi:uncharacterized RDD family membrane protein YckC